MNNTNFEIYISSKFLLGGFRWLLVLFFFPLCATAQIVWPEGQLLPSFPAPAQTQDLIYLNDRLVSTLRTWTWQAEGTELSHETGRLDGDGWLCETGVDETSKYMIHGAYSRDITIGANIAEFRMRVNSTTGSTNVAIADIDVWNVTTATRLASKTIYRENFTSTNYTSFDLPFILPADSQQIELRIWWRGNSYLKVDYVRVRQDPDAEMYLFSSLKGLVNCTEPRIFSYEGDASAEGEYTWLKSLNKEYVEYGSVPWNLLTKYKPEISGLIVYDHLQPHTVNLAARLAKEYKALIVAPRLLPRLTASPYNFPILLDLRGQFTSSLQVYQSIFDNYWENTDKRILIGLSPTDHKASLREYAVALGAAVIWLNPKISAESDLLNRFLASMPAGANYMGWWPEEEPGVTRLSNYGFTTIASDYCTNLTFHSGMPRLIDPRPIPAKPALENKIYVAFIISDGDNLQYVEHRMRRFWDDPNRGSVPVGWTVSPAMVDAMPGALNYFHQSSTDNDNLISGPSGYGYTYPNNWINNSLNDALADFAAKTEAYNVAGGLRVITIWNTITGGIDGRVGNIFANNAPTLLGLTAQNTGGSQVIYSSKLPGKPLSCNYCTGEQAMKDHIISGSNGWNGASPRFLIIQGNPWNSEVNPTGFKNVKNYFSSGEYAGKYVFVRPDHIFQLIREANGLPVNPGAVEGNGEGLTGRYYNGQNFDTQIAGRIDGTVDFDWGNDSPMTGVDADNFTIRWKGFIQPSFTGNYTFYVTCDGVRLWVDKELIIDNLQGGRNPATYTGKIYSLTAGEQYEITLEYLEKSGVAQCKLEWTSAFLPREVVPQSQLYKDNSVGINTGNAVSNLKVFAANGVLNVEMHDYNNEEIAWSIYDLCGKVLLQQNICTGKAQIDISNFAKGIYLISVRTKYDSKTVRFINN